METLPRGCSCVIVKAVGGGAGLMASGHQFTRHVHLEVWGSQNENRFNVPDISFHLRASNSVSLPLTNEGRPANLLGRVMLPCSSCVIRQRITDYTGLRMQD